MAKYPIRVDISKPKVTPKPMNRAAPPTTQGALNRSARMQGEESISEGLLLRRGTPDIIRTTVNMRPTPTKKGK